MGRGISMLVMRAVQVVRPRSSTMSMEWMHRVRPSLTAVQVAVTTPETAGRTWVASMSSPRLLRGFRRRARPRRASRGSRPEPALAPPCSRPMGWVLPATGHGRNGAFCGEFLELNAHGGDELAQAAGEVGVQVLGDSAFGSLALDFFCGEGGGCCRADRCVRVCCFQS